MCEERCKLWHTPHGLQFIERVQDEMHSQITFGKEVINSYIKLRNSEIEERTL